MNPFEADLGVFLDGAFSVPCLRSDGSSFRGIFDEAFFDPSAGETVLETTRPRLQAKLSDVSMLRRRQSLTVNGRAFTVKSVMPDGTGMAVVELSNQSAPLAEDEEDD